ncbi:MAG: protein-methionine-sulfoxide reductase catalytic subunit MsrP [Acidobacteriota bacterium]
MPAIRLPPSWRIPERLATPEREARSRRRFLRQTALGGLGLAMGACSADPEGSRAAALDGSLTSAAQTAPAVGGAGRQDKDLFPAQRHPGFVLDRDLTDEAAAAANINYYEFTTDKARVAGMTRGFKLHPWSVHVTGLVHRPRTWAMENLLRAFPLEERLYRHRCVEAWSMAVPWTGFPMASFIKVCEPLSAARYVRFISFMRPKDAPGQAQMAWYPWPYTEMLTLAEAMNELTLLVVGIYGHPLPAYHGAPLRLVVPWKYGYKSAKGIVQIEFTAQRPATFWNTVSPGEYGFTSNVNPSVPHPRWSQATERLLGTGRRVKTLLYNGYAAQVAHLYS